MVTVYATLRQDHDPVLTSLRRRASVRRTVVFHTGDEVAADAIETVRAHCHARDIPFETVKVDADHLVESAQRIQRVLRDDSGPRTVFNVTDGDHMLTTAALLGSTMEGVQAVWVPEGGKEIPLPLITTRYVSLLTDAQRRVITHIADHDGCTQADLRKALGLSKPTVSHHIRSLLRYRLVEEAPDPSDGRRKTLHVIPTVHLLLEGKI